jgi:oxygen-dependent protoporphyrinogen oxidase
LRVAREWWYPARVSNGDESVAALVERHYGAEMVDRLADPLLAGVYGGEAAQLSVRAVLPRFVEMESKYGSLGRGMLAARKNVQRFPASAFDLLLSQGSMQQTRGGFGGQASRRGVAGKLSRAGRPEAGSRLGGFGRIRFPINSMR